MLKTEPISRLMLCEFEWFNVSVGCLHSDQFMCILSNSRQIRQMSGNLEGHNHVTYSQ